jgi:hypothetical protein
VQFSDAWRELSAIDLVRLLAAPALLVAATLLPGARIVRIAAIGVAVLIPGLRELACSAPQVAGWSALWLFLAWRAAGTHEGETEPLTPVRGMFETGTLSLVLGVLLVMLLIVGVGRQDLSPEDARRASWGVLMLGIGLLHLMLRRHARRSAVAFAAMGLGLQVLDGAARGAQVRTHPEPTGGVLLATAIASLVVLRIASARERHAGSPWVHDAHDLHD